MRSFMRKLLLLISFFTATPVFVVLLAIFLVSLSYQHKYGINGVSFMPLINKPIAYAALPSDLNVVSDSVTEEDSRVGKVNAFLTAYNSPLAQYSSLIVSEADTYDIDYRLVPAIAMQESIACKREIPGTHNCWGYGIYGKKVTSFDSYEQAIDTITRYFSKKKTNGVSTLEQIGAIYNPTNHNDWQAHVASFMAQL